MPHHDQKINQSGDGDTTWSILDGVGPRRRGWRELRDERTIVIMRNDLTVIRGQAQLLKRALVHQDSESARTTCERLDAIITSVDEANLELFHLQSSRRTPP